MTPQERQKLIEQWEQANSTLLQMMKAPELGLTSWYIAFENVQHRRNELEVKYKMGLSSE